MKQIQKMEQDNLLKIYSAYELKNDHDINENARTYWIIMEKGDMSFLQLIEEKRKKKE